MNILSKSKLKVLADYRHQKRCDEDGLFVVEGPRLCDEAVRSGFRIRTICGTSDYLSRCGKIQADIYEVTDAELERLSNQRTPNQVWMLVERQTIEIGRQPVVIALDGLQDPGNMGTIMRTADWFGIRHIVCSRQTVSCYNPKVIQSTMGAIFRTKVEYTDLPTRIEELHSEGYNIYGAMLDGEDLFKIEPQRPAVIVIGNEGNGISAEVAKAIDNAITIPNIGGTCESLNAATAAAIIVSAFYR